MKKIKYMSKFLLCVSALIMATAATHSNMTVANTKNFVATSKSNKLGKKGKYFENKSGITDFVENEKQAVQGVFDFKNGIPNINFKIKFKDLKKQDSKFSIADWTKCSVNSSLAAFRKAENNPIATIYDLYRSTHLDDKGQHVRLTDGEIDKIKAESDEFKNNKNNHNKCLFYGKTNKEKYNTFCIGIVNKAGEEFFDFFPSSYVQPDGDYIELNGIMPYYSEINDCGKYGYVPLISRLIVLGMSKKSEKDLNRYIKILKSLKEGKCDVKIYKAKSMDFDAKGRRNNFKFEKKPVAVFRNVRIQGGDELFYYLNENISYLNKLQRLFNKKS